MKNILATYIRISLAAAALLLVAAGQSSIHAQKEEQGASLESANRLVGAWETTVTPRNCATGEQIGPPFQGVSTYNAGGTMAEFGANPAAPFRTPGHGVWVSNLGSSTYSMKFSFLPLTPAGAPIGRMRITQEIELSRFSDEFTSSGGFVLTNFAGVVLATGCTTATAVRVQL